MNKAFNMIQDIAKVSSTNPTQKVLLVVWYWGHGELFDGSAATATTQVLTNDSDATKRRYPFEQKLGKIASLDNTYIITFMDNCRNWVQNYYVERSIILQLHI
jgi:hypothetical protein